MAPIIPRIDFPEIVIGLVAPIGTPITETISEIKSYFEEVNYKVHEIRVTDFFRDFCLIVPPNEELREKPLSDRYDTYIKYGNQIRGRSGDQSIWAALAIQRIAETRISESHSEHSEYTKNVYIIHQFKRPEEIDLLRSVYGKIFFQVSVYSVRSARVDYLSRRFAEDAGHAIHSSFRAAAENLVDVDENQIKEKYGQRVAKIFYDADVIINKDVRKPNVREQVVRFLELLFSSNRITPSKSEYGMFAATSAALRTSDLSRQVGAAVFTDRGEILSLGSNEVPRAGGGTYWPDDEFDDREFRRGIDSNDKRKRELLNEILGKLDITWEGLEQNQREAIEDSSFMDALEYGRIIHAEMSAISDAARQRGSLANSVLYSTTFPCHMCAKHIVASGVKKVVYLEPYPKSLAYRLHTDSIDIDKQERGEYREYPAVEFIHFYGVTPRRYRELFHRGKRKNKEGVVEAYIGNTKRPNIDIKSPFYVQLEDIVMNGLITALPAFAE